MKLTIFFVSNILVCLTDAYVCTTEVLTSNDRIVTFVDCNSIFEICCAEGCCSRFSHTHIWVFASGISFIICICIFGCWLFCCKNLRRARSIQQRPPRNDDRVDSPLTLVTDIRSVTSGVTNRNSAVPVTPPPTYEEATAMR